MPGQAPDTTTKTGTGEAIPGHSHVSKDTAAQVMKIYIEVFPDHDIGIITTTEVAHNAQVMHTGVIAINPSMTNHIDHTTDC